MLIKSSFGHQPAYCQDGEVKMWTKMEHIYRLRPIHSDLEKTRVYSLPSSSLLKDLPSRGPNHMPGLSVRRTAVGWNSWESTRDSDKSLRPTRGNAYSCRFSIVDGSYSKKEIRLNEDYSVRVHRSASHAADFSLSYIETHTTTSTNPHRADRIISNAYMRCILMTSYGIRTMRTDLLTIYQYSDEDVGRISALAVSMCGVLLTIG
uniref:SFRICE_005500 n=1 Tax=Spodoptera frugiperda TaxID=7108 RepID=A0A2H1X2R8_SPOFR